MSMLDERIDERSRHDVVLHALADHTRRRVLGLLGVAGEATASELAEHLPVSRQAVVQHLGTLESAGLAASRRHGRRVLYRTLPGALDDTARWMASIAADWDRRLDAIRRIAEDDPPNDTGRERRTEEGGGQR